MKTIRVRVTQKDIACGKKDNAASCPLAKAVRRRLGVRSAEIDGFSADINTGAVTLPLPKRAVRFVNRFDWYGRESVKPFSFALKLNKKASEYLNS